MVRSAVDGHVVQDLWNAETTMATVIVGPRGWQTAALAKVHAQGEALKEQARGALASQLLAPVKALLRSWRRRLQSLNSDLLITLMCATHALEGLVKIGL